MVDAGDARLKRMEEADKIIRDMAAGGVHEGGPGTRQATQNSAHPLAKVWLMIYEAFLCWLLVLGHF